MSFKDQLLSAGVVSEDDVKRVESEDETAHERAQREHLTLQPDSDLKHIYEVYLHRLMEAETMREVVDVANDFVGRVKQSPDARLWEQAHGSRGAIVGLPDEPLSRDEVARLEEQLGMSLPPSYREFLLTLGPVGIWDGRGRDFLAADDVIRGSKGFSEIYNEELKSGGRRWQDWEPLKPSEDVDEIAIIAIGPDDADQWLIIRNAVVEEGSIEYPMSAEPAGTDVESPIFFAWHDDFEAEPRTCHDLFGVLYEMVEAAMERVTYECLEGSEG